VAETRRFWAQLQKVPWGSVELRGAPRSSVELRGAAPWSAGQLELGKAALQPTYLPA
jgi:hypothetical protein